jgi:hypothetical protein
MSELMANYITKHNQTWHIYDFITYCENKIEQLEQKNKRLQEALGSLKRIDEQPLETDAKYNLFLNELKAIEDKT